MPDSLPMLWGLLVRAPWRVLRRSARRAVGRDATMDSPDRKLLEDCILPHYRARPDVREVLFVGTRWYTRGYAERLDRQHFVTLDIDPRAARHGSAQRHIVACVSEVERHFAPDSLDLIVLNGVFGWGLNDRERMQRALQGFHRVLRPGGELLIGWNDVPGHRPFDLHRVPALAKFEPLRFEPLGVQSVTLPTDNRHCFEFYRKPLAAVPAYEATAYR